jgi:hypothetical protein
MLPRLSPSLLVCRGRQAQRAAAEPLAVPHPPACHHLLQGVCTSHAMDGCQECTSQGRTNFRSCPEVFAIYGRLCNCELGRLARAFLMPALIGLASRRWPRCACAAGGGGVQERLG